jgi:Pentapeptide repeats (8 copies)
MAPSAVFRQPRLLYVTVVVGLVAIAVCIGFLPRSEDATRLEAIGALAFGFLAILTAGEVARRFGDDAGSHAQPGADTAGEPIRRGDEAARASAQRHQPNVVLTRARLSKARLLKINLEGAELDGARLEDADLEGAELAGAILTDAVLRRADLRGANLKGADLRGADLRDAKLAGADLAGAIFNERTKPPRLRAPLSEYGAHDRSAKRSDEP